MAARPADGLERGGARACSALARKRPGKSEAEAGGADREGFVRRRFADRLEVALEHGVNDRRAATLAFELAAGARSASPPCRDGRQIDEADRDFGLALQTRARDWSRASDSADDPSAGFR